MELDHKIINSNKRNIFHNNFLFNNNLTTNNNYPSFRIISSLFTKDYKNTFNDNKNNNDNNIKDNDNDNNNKLIKSNINIDKYSINSNIYNIKENSIFLIKIFGQYIKYFPIFTESSNYEKYIHYNPFLEFNPNFEIISNNNEIHFEFYIKNYHISNDKFEKIKEKYVKHNFTKRNIISLEEIFKYLFEEIKININLINEENKNEENLKLCSKLINNINEIIEEIINENKNDKNNFCLFNNDKIKKNIILNKMNSKSIEYNFLQNDTINKELFK